MDLTNGFSRFKKSMKVFTLDDPVVAEAADIKELAEEEIGWRRLGGSGIVTNQPFSQENMQKVVLKLFRSNHWGGRIIQLIVDFVWGDGINVIADHEDEATQDLIQEVIDDFWYDPINDMSRTLEQTLTEWELWGEICIPVLTSPSGKVRLGWITPSAISEVSNDLLGRPHSVTVNSDYIEMVGKKKLKVVQIDVETDEIEGEVFFFPINGIRGNPRGVSTLYSSADWLDVMVESLKANADRTKLANHFIWDVTCTGMGPEDLKKFKKEHAQAPKPNSVRVHNEKVKWESISPNLGSLEFKGFVDTLKSFIMGGFGLPNHWFGSGDDANLATASVMAEPTKKNLKRKQKQVTWMISDIIRYVLHAAQKSGRIPLTVDLSNNPFKIQIPDLGGNDAASTASATQAFMNALVVAVNSGLTSEETAIEIASLILSQTGIDILASDEKDRLDSEGASRKEEEENSRIKSEADLKAMLKAVDGDDQDEKMIPVEDKQGA